MNRRRQREDGGPQRARVDNRQSLVIVGTIDYRDRLLLGERRCRRRAAAAKQRCKTSRWWWCPRGGRQILDAAAPPCPPRGGGGALLVNDRPRVVRVRARCCDFGGGGSSR